MTPSTLADLLSDPGDPERPVLADPSGGHVTLARIVEGAARIRARARMTPGARVGLLLPNLPVFPAAFHAVVGTGASAVLLNPLSAPREIAESCEDAGVERIVTVRGMADLCGDVEAVLLDESAGPRSTDEVGGAPAPPVDPDDEAVVVYTSAMDGRARGARLSHRSLLANARSSVAAMGLRKEDVVLAMLPWCHLFGLTVTLDAPMLAGATILPMPRFHPGRALETLGAAGVSVLAGVPAMYHALCEAADDAALPDHRLRLAICGGATLSHETARRFEERFGVPLRQGYGLTEAGPVCLFNRVDRPNRIGSLGRPFPDVEVSVRDAGGTELATGEVGELWVGGENVFAGYVGGAGASTSWLRTGDLASRDDDGTFRFRGVWKSMFTRNGFNIYPREVARAVEEDPRVREARVYAAPDPTREHEIVLEIHPEREARIDEAAARGICATRLAAYKQPGRIRVVHQR